jgi:hypothetical protein
MPLSMWRSAVRLAINTLAFALCVQQMPDVPRVHDVEHAVTHDHFVRTRRLAKNLTQLLGRLDLVLILVRKCERHVFYPAFGLSPRY